MYGQGRSGRTYAAAEVDPGDGYTYVTNVPTIVPPDKLGDHHFCPQFGFRVHSYVQFSTNFARAFFTREKGYHRRLDWSRQVCLLYTSDAADE